jgi:hypothetical protein
VGARPRLRVARHGGSTRDTSRAAA